MTSRIRIVDASTEIQNSVDPSFARSSTLYTYLYHNRGELVEVLISITMSLKAHVEDLVRTDRSGHTDHHDEWLALLQNWESEQQA
jgi:hypothetical protein